MDLLVFVYEVEFHSEKCCVLNTCAHYIRYVKRCNRQCVSTQKLVHGLEFLSLSCLFTTVKNSFSTHVFGKNVLYFANICC